MSTVAADLLAPFLRAPLRSGIFLDFDGTLSPIVDDPASASLAEGAADLLRGLAARYQVVAVLSGRPVSFLEPLLPASIAVCGLYGLEVLHDGVRVDHPSAGAWREVIDDIAVRSRAHGPEGMGVEPKGLSLTLHYRTRPELADDVAAWAGSMSAASGLALRPAKMSVELHPPLDVDKGTAVDSLAERLAAAVFIGDDLGDLPAFDALDRLAARGGAALRVAVRGPESPPELLDRADLAVDGTDGVLELLRRLLGDGTSARGQRAAAS